MIETAGDTWEESVHTDAAGAWQVASIGPGKHAIHANSSLHVETADQVFEHDGVTPKTGVVVRVELGGQIAGTVTDASGRPVADARVSTSHGSESTDAAGRFTVTGLPEDDYEVYASNDTGVSPITNLKLARGAHADVKLVMVTSSISGKVADSHGAPIENAFVYASSKLTQRSYFEHTDARGHFNLGGVPPGDYEIAAQRAEESAREMPPGVVVQSGNHRVALVLPDLGSISGRVILDGKPVRSFGLVVSGHPEHTLFDSPRLVRDETGRFAQPDIGPGTWGIVIVGPGFTRKVVEGIQLAAGGKVDVGDIVVERGRSISGQVRDQRGAPVAGAMVGVYDHKSFSSVSESMNERMQGNLFAHTDTAGRYRIDGINPAATGQRIEATHALGVSVERELAADETTVDLVVSATGDIAGSIIDMNPRQGHAIAKSVDDTRGATFRADIDAAGFFTFDRMPPGEYSVRILGRNTLGRQRATVVAGQRATLTFAMPKHPVTAVFDVTGGCRMVSVSSGDDSRSTESCEQDRATLPGLAPGRYKACVDFDDCVDLDILPSPQRQTFTLHAN
jgi:protocatechuate 3,4-dioxygenase beta subunit